MQLFFHPEADTDATLTDGRMLLSIAAEHGHLAVVDFLLQAEADNDTICLVQEVCPIHLKVECWKVRARDLELLQSLMP